MKKGYKVINRHTTQQVITEIVTFEKPDGTTESIIVTNGYGKWDGTFESNKWGEGLDTGEPEHDFVSWYHGYVMGFHDNWEDDRINK